MEKSQKILDAERTIEERKERISKINSVWGEVETRKTEAEANLARFKRELPAFLASQALGEIGSDKINAVRVRIRSAEQIISEADLVFKGLEAWANKEEQAVRQIERDILRTYQRYLNMKEALMAKHSYHEQGWLKEYAGMLDMQDDCEKFLAVYGEPES